MKPGGIVVGVDVGGTRIKAVAMARHGLVKQSRVIATLGQAGPKDLEATIVGVVRALASKCGDLRAVGVGLPGAVDPEQGVVMLPGRLDRIAGYPLVPRLRQALGVPVVADNDGRAGVVAEHRHGRLRGKQWGVCLMLGTGVGSGVLLDGRVLRDPHLQFGTQMAHIINDVNSERLCLTGARGTAEMSCSATALAHAVRDGLGRGIPSRLSRLFDDDPRRVDFQAVAAAAAKGDRLCRDEMGHWQRRLGWLVVSAVHVYAPEVVVLAGGAMNAAPQFLRQLRAQVKAHVFRHPPGAPLPIVLSALGDHQGAVGAAALGWDKINEGDPS